MTRRVLFQIHWFLGLTAGFVLAVMGVTGATIAFEDEIVAALNPGIVTLAPAAAPPLAPDALVAAALRAHGGKVTRLTLQRDPTLAAKVTFAPPKGQRRGETRYIDPRSGALLPHPAGEGFFRFVEDLHRWLALPGGANGIGRQITGFSAIALIFFALSGLYLRWPRRALDWRAWLVLDLRKTGRNLYRALHAVVGGWVLVFYLLSALTGLTWSYDWYKQGARYVLTGKAGNERDRRGAEADGPAPALAPAWATFVGSDGARYDRVTITLPSGDAPVTMRMLPRGARFDRMTDELRFDAATGALVKAERYAARGVGETIAANFYALHTGSFFGLPGRIVMLLTSLTMPLFTITGLLLYLARRRSKRALAAVAASLPAATGGDGHDLLVVHASQTGNAERLARLSAAAFPGAQIAALGDLDPATLAQARRALFVVATYGEGHAPDRARRFEGRVMAAPADLAQLDYAVLALGDRQYPEFCAFGQRVDAWLHRSGGRRLFDRVEVDGADNDAERHWQQQLAAIAGHAIQPDWQRADYGRWTLTAREQVNPGSPGAPVFRVILTPEVPVAWQPGAIAEVMPRHDPARVDRWLATAGRDDDATLRASLVDKVLPDDPAAPLRPLAHRDYSVASIAESGAAELLVRACPAPDGGLGLGSGWLTRVAPLGGTIALRVRDNPGFAPAADDVPIVLIGNGTGIAGLMAHLRARARIGGAPAWLLYGERTRAHDRPYAAELDSLQAQGTLTRLDLAFSRDAECGRYVQHLVAEAADGIADWAARGAAIYVCGSLSGMAGAVDAALRAILGDEVLETMAQEGRYRRDVY
ncbi:PepSY domain-containing protein [Sphingomonas sp. Leaf25]|uniref:PepSY domain-containing protein n=1 Tax=Sphingomonas sp. Leaf25 TaxID=1735692 RepID=UPI0006FCD7BE|nr:sulfite reductase flavoprotein subunit alpha [Sphingomonas sp. Leaf25]KQN07300.1 sulfite reductase subunit alpha [Sphingomonas sp. Leaf25]